MRSLAPLASQRFPRLLGGPFFTSVPAGRVGRTTAHHFRTHGGFQGALVQQEAADAQYIQAVLPGLTTSEADESTPAIGVSNLRRFLEEVLRERYVGSLRAVVPQLQQADAKLSHELASIDDALKELTVWHAHQALRVAVDKFAASLQSAVRGVPSAAATALGQKLAEEQAASGARFSAHDSLVGPVQNSDRHLFGGSQYYRVLNEFSAAVQSLPIEPVSAEDLTNAMGLAVNGQCERVSVATIMLQRCVAAVHPLVVHLFRRLQYVVERMLGVRRGYLGVVVGAIEHACTREGAWRRAVAGARGWLSRAPGCDRSAVQ